MARPTRGLLFAAKNPEVEPVKPPQCIILSHNLFYPKLTRPKTDKLCMARNETSHRILRVLHYLETTRLGITAQAIQERLAEEDIVVSLKTVKRDIDCLEMAKFTLEKEKTEEGTKWRMSSFAKINSNISFSYKEIFAQYMARKYLEHLKGSPLYADLDLFFTKIEKLVGVDCDAFKEFAQNLQFKAKTTWHNSVSPGVLDTVYTALEEGHSLKFKYKSQSGVNAQKLIEREVGPECLYFADAGVYLIAVDLEKKEPRTFALARMEDVVDNHEVEYKKQGIEPKELFAKSFGVLNSGEVEDIEILLSGPVAKYIVERKWHNSQKVVQREDGLHLYMQVKVNDELARWVMGLGQGTEVIKSENLKQLVLANLEAMLAHYQNKKVA